MKNNKGFSLIELIIVVAIMAVLIGVLVPNLLKYVDKAKRTNDVKTAKEIKRCMDTLILLDHAHNYVAGSPRINVMWNKDSVPEQGTEDVFNGMFNMFGGVPVSAYNEDLFWCVLCDYNSYGALEVQKILLVDGFGQSMGYELYPDESEFLLHGAQVPVSY